MLPWIDSSNIYLLGKSKSFYLSITYWAYRFIHAFKLIVILFASQHDAKIESDSTGYKSSKNFRWKKAFLLTYVKAMKTKDRFRTRREGSLLKYDYKTDASGTRVPEASAALSPWLAGKRSRTSHFFFRQAHPSSLKSGSSSWKGWSFWKNWRQSSFFLEERGSA